MRKLLAAVTGTIAATVLMLAPTSAASAAPAFHGLQNGGGAQVMCTWCNVGF
ncbi:hypothetical protein [Nakamurella lactea]|uniref:hypothetical protein n=1 Tax=Nakamurella lactea TaxID=459515 RepID=UPI000411BBC0|nr:hypothetical protein [Nakamurella lactea]